jgi:hypothetical protein
VSRFAEVLKGPSYDEIEDPAQALMQKDQSIMDYQETVEILQVRRGVNGVGGWEEALLGVLPRQSPHLFFLLRLASAGQGAEAGATRQAQGQKNRR